MTPARPPLVPRSDAAAFPLLALCVLLQLRSAGAEMPIAVSAAVAPTAPPSVTIQDPPAPDGSRDAGQSSTEAEAQDPDDAERAPGPRQVCARRDCAEHYRELTSILVQAGHALSRGSRERQQRALRALGAELAGVADCASNRVARFTAAIYLADTLASRDLVDPAFELLAHTPRPPGASEASEQRVRGTLHVKRGELAEALRRVEEGRAAGPGSGESALLDVLEARVQMLLGRLDIAERLLRSVDRAQLDNPWQLWFARLDLALVRADYEAARQHASSASPELQDLVDALVAYGDDAPDAAERMGDALEVAEPLGLRPLLMSRLLELAIRRRDRTESQRLLDGLYDGSPQTLRGDSLLAAIRRCARRAYAGEVALLDSAAHTESSERARRLAAVRDDLAEALDELLARFSSLPEVRGGIGLLTQDDIAFALSVLAKLEVACDAGSGHGRGALDGTIARLMRAQAQASRTPVEPGDLEPNGLHRMLAADDAVLLFWLPGRIDSVVVVADGRSTRVVRSVANGRALRRSADLARSRLAAAVRQPALREAAEHAVDRLRRALCPDAVAHRLQTTKRLYVDSSAVGLLPIEAFRIPGLVASERRAATAPRAGDPSGEATGQEARSSLMATDEPAADGEHAAPSVCLGAASAVYHLASLPRAVARSDAERGARPSKLAVLASIRGVPGVGDRVLGSDAIADLIATFPERSVRLGRDARAEFLASAAARDADVLLVLGHGVSPVGDDIRTAISLGPGPDALVDAAAFARPSRPRLTILSACRAAEGPARTGAGPLSATLPGTLLEAGEGCVATAVCDLELVPHVAAMTAFLRGLREGADAGTALARVRAAAPDDLSLLTMQLHGIDR